MKFLVNEKYKEFFFVLGFPYILYKTYWEACFIYLKNTKILCAMILLQN